MSDERQYKHKGYKEYESRPAPSQPPKSASGQKLPSFTAYREAIRCDICGAELSIHFEIGFDSHCSKCRAPLHTCRNCLHLDPSARWECSRPITERVPDKQAVNRCPAFEARRIRVKETSFSTSPSPDDARKTLENLFRKK